MWYSQEQKKTQLDKLVEHPGLISKKLYQDCYSIEFGNQRWILWPNGGRYRFVREDGGLSDLYFGSTKHFYQRYITEEKKAPENYGKMWSKQDEDILFDMIDQFCTVEQMAEELKRYPYGIVTRLCKFLEKKELIYVITTELFDVAVRELIEWVDIQDKYE